MLRPVASLLAAALALAILSAPALAQSVDGQRQLINNGVVGVMGGGVSGTSATLAWDMSVALDDGYDLRVLPMMGKGAVRSVEDLLLLKGVDVAIVQADVMDFYKKTAIYPDIDSSIGYIAKLYNEELHLIVRSDIESIDQLRGKSVNFGPDSSGSFMTASIIFDQLGISVKAESYPFDEGLSKLKAGEIDGWFRVAGAPASQIGDIKKSDGLHLLALPTDRLSETYTSTKLTADTYPELIDPGKDVTTAAVGAVMAAYNWRSDNPRFDKVQRFIKALHANLPKLQSGSSFHPKWKEVNLATKINGWTRIQNAGDANLTQ